MPSPTKPKRSGESVKDPMECQQCGQTHERCTAHNRSGNPCGKKPKADMTVCGTHGGSAPQTIAAAERRKTEREAIVALEAFGVPVVVDYQTALLQELHRTAGAVQWLGAIVADLDQSAITWGQTRQKTGGEDHGNTYEASRNAWVKLWQDERKHLVDVAATCGRAGIEERRVQLAEDQGRMLAGVITRILAGMFDALVAGLDGHEAARAKLEQMWGQLVGQIVPTELRAIAVSSEVVAS